MITHNILFLLFPISFVVARFCIDDQKGSCQGHELWGWCFHNKTGGKFDCDDDGFCASQDQLKNKKSSGCFQRANSSVCCCNDADGCNLGFIQVAPKYAHGQLCANLIESPGEDVRLFRPCDDPYCYALLSAEENGGPTTAVRGCYSRKLVMHSMAKKEDEKYNNNTKWQETAQMASLPTCAEILSEEAPINGTRTLCLEFEYEQDADDEEEEPIKMKGRLCCCDGSPKCNEELVWSDNAITLDELKQIMNDRENPSSISGLSQNLITMIANTIFLFFLFK